MENTCGFDTCAVAKRMKLKKPQECVNYIESWWTKPEGKPVLVQDCAPRRTTLMIQDLYNRLIGVEQSQEQQRNMLATLEPLVKVAKEYQTGLLLESQ